MKKLIPIILMFIMALTILTSCGSDNDCGMCNGSGYYDHKTCPACRGTGESDFDPYDIMDDVYGD